MQPDPQPPWKVLYRSWSQLFSAVGWARLKLGMKLSRFEKNGMM